MSPARTMSSNRTPRPIRMRRGILCMPVACGEELGVQRSFRRARLGVPVVAPFHDRRQRLLVGFGVVVCLLVVLGVVVFFLVVFVVVAASVGLEVAFAFAVCVF